MSGVRHLLKLKEKEKLNLGDIVVSKDQIEIALERVKPSPSETPELYEKWHRSFGAI